MDHDPIYRQRIGNKASMLPARPAKARERIACYVMPSSDRNFLYGVRHVGDGDGKKALSGPLGRQYLTCRNLHRCNKILKFLYDNIGIKRLITSCPEHSREVVGTNFAEQHIAIGHSQRPATPVTRRTWNCAG